ncbi:MAG: hypothetical protein AAGI30_02655 [Planctomycetota bacterium]
MPQAAWEQRSLTAWESQFDRPTEAEVLSHYNQQTLGMFTLVREKLHKLGEMTEVMEYMGPPWHWCFLINPADAAEGRERSWAYLVPNTEVPLLAMPMDLTMVERLPMRRIKKHVREQVARGKKVGTITYAEWSINAKSQLEDIMEMVNRLYKLRTEDPLNKTSKRG